MKTKKDQLNQLVGKVRDIPNISAEIIEDIILLESKSKKMMITFNPEEEIFTVLGNYNKKYLRKKIKDYNLFNESDHWKAENIILLDSPGQTLTSMYYGVPHHYSCDPRATHTELYVKQLSLPPIQSDLCEKTFFCYEIKS